jgi:hypothetical protein
LAEPDRVRFHPAVAALGELDESEPLVRFACALAVHAFEIDTGLIEGPFDQARAERYARELLMPVEDSGLSPGSRTASLQSCSACPSSRYGSGVSISARDRPAPATALAYASRAHAREKQPDHPGGGSMSDPTTVLVAERDDARREELNDQFWAEVVRSVAEVGCRAASDPPRLVLLGAPGRGRPGPPPGAVLDATGSLIELRGGRRAA